MAKIGTFGARTAPKETDTIEVCGEELPLRTNLDGYTLMNALGQFAKTRDDDDGEHRITAEDLAQFETFDSVIRGCLQEHAYTRFGQLVRENSIGVRELIDIAIELIKWSGQAPTKPSRAQRRSSARGGTNTNTTYSLASQELKSSGTSARPPRAKKPTGSRARKQAG